MEAETNVVELEREKLDRLLANARASFSAEDFAEFERLVNAYQHLLKLIGTKSVTLERLRRIIFGPTSEKTEQVFKGMSEPDTAEKPKEQHPGHGRNGVNAYPNAKKVKVPHPSLQSKDCCPDCGCGKVYPYTPGSLVRITGQAPLEATAYELAKFRCNACGKTFQAPLPAGVEYTKYDASAASMIGLLKYGSGVPFNRLANLQADIGVPLPAATQWEIVKEAAERLKPAHQELIREAAQGKVLHNDDTNMKITELAKENEVSETGSQRKGCFTTGIVSLHENHKIALFFTGTKHAGENLEDLLKQRAAELKSPIQMCDALSRNSSEDFKTILANCMSHARRKFVEAADNFPRECKHLLDILQDVYKNDAATRQQKMPDQERLLYHQANSKELMQDLKQWAESLLAEKKVEPNSGLGQALAYLLKHWNKLTLFLKVPGAPLDNNICERALKKAILHRKNALFYKTTAGALVGDTFMSLIHTTELVGGNPFDYLTALLRNSQEVSKMPQAWMPWNYKVVLAALDQQPNAHPPP